MLTRQQQKLVMDIHKKGKITTDTQSAYKGKNFYRAISHLVKSGLIRTQKKFQNENYYILTLKGELQALMLYSYKFKVQHKEFKEVYQLTSQDTKILFHTANQDLTAFMSNNLGWSVES